MSSSIHARGAARDPVGVGAFAARERRKAETRQRILVAARRLFVERGYHATRPQDIAREARVAAGTFYLYFADKREVFLAFTEEAGRELMDSVARRAGGAGSFDARLRSALEAILEYADAHPGVLRVALADESVIASGSGDGPLLRDRLARTLTGGLREGVRAGGIHDDIDAELVAHAIVGAIQQGLVFGSQRMSRRALVEGLTRFCSRAVIVPVAAPREGGKR